MLVWLGLGARRSPRCSAPAPRPDWATRSGTTSATRSRRRRASAGEPAELAPQRQARQGAPTPLLRPRRHRPTGRSPRSASVAPAHARDRATCSALDAPLEALSSDPTTTALVAVAATRLVAFACARLADRAWAPLLDALALAALAYLTALALDGVDADARARRRGGRAELRRPPGRDRLRRRSRWLHALAVSRRRSRWSTVSSTRSRRARARRAATLALAFATRSKAAAALAAALPRRALAVTAGGEHTGQTLLSVLWALSGVGDAGLRAGQGQPRRPPRRAGPARGHRGEGVPLRPRRARQPRAGRLASSASACCCCSVPSPSSGCVRGPTVERVDQAAPPPDLRRRGAARGRDASRSSPSTPTRSASCESRTSCAPGSGSSRTSARRSRSSARPARRATTRATSRPPARPRSSASRATRSSPAAARGSWRRPTAARRRPARLSVGLGIELPHEQALNEYVDVGADLPLLLHPQGHVRPLRERVRGLPRRLRDARRALRGRHPAPDAEDPLLPDRAVRQRATGAG